MYAGLSRSHTSEGKIAVRTCILRIRETHPRARADLSQVSGPSGLDFNRESPRAVHQGPGRATTQRPSSVGHQQPGAPPGPKAQKRSRPRRPTCRRPHGRGHTPGRGLPSAGTLQRQQVRPAWGPASGAAQGRPARLPQTGAALAAVPPGTSERRRRCKAAAPAPGPIYTLWLADAEACHVTHASRARPVGRRCYQATAVLWGGRRGTGSLRAPSSWRQRRERILHMSLVFGKRGFVPAEGC